MRPKVITVPIVLAIALAGLLGPGRQPSSGQEQDGSRFAQLVCCNVSVWVPPWPNYVAGYSTDCKGYMRDAPAKVQEDICNQMKEKGLICPDTASYCAPKPKCQNYSGEITCDCNGDGQDETTKSFESCGLPGPRPASFKSRCEDWVHIVFIISELRVYYDYATESTISQEGRAYLEQLEKNCPTLRCRSQKALCRSKADTELEMCKKFRGSIPCEADAMEARDKCSREGERCMKNIRRGGPGPRPQPLPTPTPRTFRPTLPQIFGSGLFTNPGVAVPAGFWTKPCIGSQLESNL